jgi:hypothetical protein
MNNQRSLFYISLIINDETWFVVGAALHFPVALTQNFDLCQLAGEKYINSLVKKLKDRGAFNTDSLQCPRPNLTFDDNTINSIKINKVIITHKED